MYVYSQSSALPLVRVNGHTYHHRNTIDAREHIRTLCLSNRGLKIPSVGSNPCCTPGRLCPDVQACLASGRLADICALFAHPLKGVPLRASQRFQVRGSASQPNVAEASFYPFRLRPLALLLQRLGQAVKRVSVVRPVCEACAECLDRVVRASGGELCGGKGLPHRVVPERRLKVGQSILD